MKEFIFNEHQVCLNHNAYEIYRETWRANITIYTAFTGKGWVHGQNVHGYTQGMSCGCSKGDWEPLFETEKEAFLNSLEVAKAYITRDMKDKKMLEAIKNQQFFPEFKQLELF